MDTQIFQELGFTPAETKIYLALLEIGTCTAGPILKKTKLQNSVVHMTLQKMVEKGVVSFILVGKVKQYSCTNPKNLLLLVKEKEEELQKLQTKVSNALPELLLLQENKSTQQAEVFKDFRGLKNMLYTLIEDAQKGDEYLFMNYFTPNPKQYEKIYNFYKEFEKERHKKGIVIKGIAPQNAKVFFKGRDTKNIRFVQTFIPANITIFKDYVAIEPAWKDEIVVFLMKSEDLADGFRTYWKTMWSASK